MDEEKPPSLSHGHARKEEEVSESVIPAEPIKAEEGKEEPA
jgi:hypothetical protein